MLSVCKHASLTTEAAPEVLYGNGVLKNFTKFLLNKVPGMYVTL